MSFDLIFQNAVRLHEQGRLDEAETVYRQLLEMTPEQTDLLHLLGLIAMQKRSFDSAIELLYKAVRLAPQSAIYEFTLAQALNDSGHPKEALEHYRSVLKKDDSFPETYLNMGIIFRAEGDIDRARELFQKAIDKRADFSPAYVNLALIERDLGHFDEASALLEKAVAFNPNDDEAYAQQAVTHRLAGRYEKALELYEKALTLIPSQPVYLNGQGIAFEHLGRLEEAFDSYNKAIESDPFFPDAYNNRANVYVKQGKHWEAEADYKKAVKLDPQYASAYNNLGALLYDHGRHQEALECYRSAFIINPKQAETCSNLAMAVKEAGDPGEAVGLYFNALALNPGLTQIHHYLAQALYDLYQSETSDAKETALKLAQKWKQFFPDHPIALHVCAAFEGQKPERAEAKYITELFDSFADSFEAAVQKIDYRVPGLLALAIERLPFGLRILDAGCGTGLNAETLKKHARFLTGVDLSEKMIAAAREKNLYDSLDTADLISFLSENRDRFDLVVLSDVACYFGDLKPLACGVAESLGAKGSVFLTVEKTQTGDFVLQPSGRFAHTEEYLRRVLQEAGFEKINIREEILRLEKETPVKGLLAMAEKNK